MRVAWLVAALALGSATPSQSQDVGDVAPVVSVPGLDGRPVRLVAAAGRKAMVIEFWATWCDVCDALLPRMRAAHAKYSGQVDFYGVNVTVNESKGRVQRYVDRMNLPFRTLYDDRGVAVRAFAAPATSFVVIVDAAGRIRYTGSGAEQDVAAELARIIGS